MKRDTVIWLLVVLLSMSAILVAAAVGQEWKQERLEQSQ